jgi:hypothetical protein
VEYVDVPVEHWRQALSQLDSMSPYLIEHLSAVAVSYQHGEFDALTDVVERIGGTPPQSLEAFVRQHETMFGVAPATHRTA